MDDNRRVLHAQGVSRHSVELAELGLELYESGALAGKRLRTPGAALSHAPAMVLVAEQTDEGVAAIQGCNKLLLGECEPLLAWVQTQTPGFIVVCTTGNGLGRCLRPSVGSSTPKLQRCWRLR